MFSCNLQKQLVNHLGRNYKIKCFFPLLTLVLGARAIWGRCEGRVCDCAQRVMSAVSPLLPSDLSLEDMKMSRNPLALLHMLTLERGLALTAQLCMDWVDQVLHPFYVTISVLCLRPSDTALLADFELPAAKFPRQAPAWCCGCGFSR